MKSLTLLMNVARLPGVEIICVKTVLVGSSIENAHPPTAIVTWRDGHLSFKATRAFSKDTSLESRPDARYYRMKREGAHRNGEHSLIVWSLSIVANAKMTPVYPVKSRLAGVNLPQFSGLRAAQPAKYPILRVSCDPEHFASVGVPQLELQGKPPCRDDISTPSQTISRK